MDSPPHALVAAGTEMIRRIYAAVAASVMLAGCVDGSSRPAMHERTGTSQVMIDIAKIVDHQWRHYPVRGRTDYRIVHVDGRLAIRAEGRKAASGLIRRILLDTKACPVLRWHWRVDASQRRANIAQKDGDDVAASVFLLFGDPGFSLKPDKVPTLRYVWTGGAHRVGAVIDNPYMPGVVRSLVVRNETSSLGTWVVETRNLRRDFEAAFGHPPKSRVHAIAIFTDNDQTREPVVAFYGGATARCVGSKQ